MSEEQEQIEEPPVEEAPVEEPPVDDRPEWLHEKYKTVEDQAKAYSEAARALSAKTDDLRSQVLEEAKTAALAELKDSDDLKELAKAEARDELVKELGPPESADDYQYSANVTPPEPEVDKVFREIAKENNLSPKAFEAMADLYAQMKSVDPEAEKAALGVNGEQRIDAVSKWADKHIPDSLAETATEVMKTAQGVKLVEHLASMARSDALRMLPNLETPAQGGKYTREQLREMMNDPRYSDPRMREDAFVKLVDEGYAALHARK